MSRIGRKPIEISEGVKVEVQGEMVEVEGGKGRLSRKLPRGIRLEVKGRELYLERESEGREGRGGYGLWRSLVANMVKGVSEGFERKLKLVGTGYRARAEGEKVIIACGFSHPVTVESPEGIKVEAVDEETIRVAGVDKELVGQTAARIRAIKPPEPYKGKGIRYEGEVVRRKAGKTGKAGATGEKGAA